MIISKGLNPDKIVNQYWPIYLTRAQDELIITGHISKSFNEFVETMIEQNNKILLGKQISKVN
jgi:hypothetical protein